jgi:GT2 family glycosyltransferase
MNLQDAPTVPVVSFIVVNYRVAAKVERAVRSIEEFCDVPFEVLVVDNSEQESELSALRSLLGERAQVIDAGGNGGFGRGCNLGAAVARGEYLFLLNPDARLLSRCVAKMISHLQRDPALGAIGGKLVYDDRQEGHSHGRFIGLRRPLQVLKGALWTYRDQLLRRTASKSPKHRLSGGLQRVDWCSGADLLLRKSDFAKIDGFDEKYFLYYEECDLQYRMLRELALAAAIDADVLVYHEDGGTGLDNARKRTFIEQGCLRFVHGHASSPAYTAYKLLMLQTVSVEMLISCLRTDASTALDKSKLLLEIARWQP